MSLKGWHALALVFCSVLLAYYPALFAPLNSVDDLRLAHDLLNRSGFSWADYWIPSSKSYFRPLVNSSFIIDTLLWNFEAPFLHLENLLIHLGNSLLVYGLVNMLAGRLALPKPWLPLSAALLFGLHPLNTEAVVWIAGRADLMMTTFVLLSLAFALLFLGRGSVIWCGLSVLAFFLGTLAKETALMAFPALLLIGWLAAREAPRKVSTVGRVAGFYPAFGCVPVVMLYFWLRSLALRGRDLGLQDVGQVVAAATAGMPGEGDLGSLAEPAWADLVGRMLAGAGFYVRKLLQPFPLNFGIVEISPLYLWLGWLVVLAAVYMLWRLSWWSCFVLTGMSLASIALLVSLGEFSWTPYAERYMYGPAAMMAIGAGLTLGNLFNDFRWRRRLVTVGGLLLLFCGGAIFQRALLWQDNLTLFADTVAKSPGFAMAQNELALALWNKGEKDKALEIVRNLEVPQSQVAFINRHLLMVNEGRLADAREFLLGLLDKTETHGYHTIILERLVDVTERLGSNATAPDDISRYDEEVVVYLKMLWQRTGKPFYLYRVGQKQLARGDRAAARESFALAAEKFPSDSPYREPARKLAENLRTP